MTKKNNIDIKLVDTPSSSRIKNFEKAEWEIADLEHYGRAVDFTKKRYKFVAENESKEIMGTLDLITEANIAFIDGLLVGSKFRKMGIGRQLLKRAENFAKENQCTKVWLETNDGWGAVEFYKKSGYKQTGVHENHAMGQRSLIFTKFF